MVNAAIMQPTYLPWVGYFALMDSVDIFVILDSVQFSKRSWQQRNKVKTEFGVNWLTIPVISKGKREQLITDVQIDYSGKFPNNHINLLEQAYKKTPYYGEYSEEIIKLLKENNRSLSVLTIKLILLLRDFLNINTEIRYSSEFTISSSKDKMLAELCEHLSVDEYISPPGSREYMKVSDSFNIRDISVKYFEYKHPQYHQLYGDFVEYMSVVDLLFNYGTESLQVLRRGIEG